MAQSRSDITKNALIEAAFQLFAEKGFTATSTREIAAAANTNIASITYHFSGKAGLRTACAQTIVERMTDLRNNPDKTTLPDIIKNAETTFEALVLRQGYMILILKEAGAMIRFLFREAQEESEVFDHIYENFFSPVFELFLLHWAQATGMSAQEAQTENTRLTVFSIIAQIAYFRIGQPVVARHLDWTGYDRDETLKVLATLQSNIRAIICAHRSTS